MTSLVVLYMVQQLFLPGHVEHVAGLATVRGLLGLGPGVADQALASIIFGWYSGLVYFTPIIGGFVADRWLGTRTTVILGAALMSAGHIAVARSEERRVGEGGVRTVRSWWAPYN